MNKRMRNVTVKGFFMGMILVFFGIMLSMLVISCGLIFAKLNATGITNPPFTKPMGFIIATTITLFVIFAGRLLYHFHLKKITAMHLLSEKMSRYRIASIVRFALSETATLLCAIFFFLTGFFAVLFVAAVAFIYFISLYPSKEKMIKEVNPGLNELKILDDANAIVMKIEQSVAD
jgi:hypothetical protein